jgi:hypothetical protein
MTSPAPDGFPESLRQRIAEATAGCHTEYEQHAAFLALVEERVVCPFGARVMGEDVEVVGFRAPDTGFGLIVVCRRRDLSYKIDVRSLEWAAQKPPGHEWLEAFGAWRSALD